MNENYKNENCFQLTPSFQMVWLKVLINVKLMLDKELNNDQAKKEHKPCSWLRFTGNKSLIL